MFFIGLYMTCFSLPFAIGIYPVVNKPSHPAWAETAIVVAGAAAAVGIMLMLLGWFNRKNKNILDSMQNKNSETFCIKCNVNVSTKDSKCPICGNLLKGEKLNGSNNYKNNL